MPKPENPYDRLRVHWYLDEQRQLVSTTDIMVWAQHFEHDRRRVAETKTELFWISTVFLGVDHQFGDGPPLLFETMIFERTKTTKMGPILEDLENEQWRYATWDDAEAGHHSTVRKVQRLEADAKVKAATMARIRKRMKEDR